MNWSKFDKPKLDTVCPKCGGTCDIRHNPSWDSMTTVCRVCGYSWSQKPLDAKEK